MRKNRFNTGLTYCMRVIIVLILGGYLFFGSVGCFAQDNVKIAVVDLAKVIRSYKRSEELSEQLKGEIQKRQDELSKSRVEIEKVGKELGETVDTFSKKEKEIKEGIFKQRVTDLREMEQKFNLELRNIQMNMQTEVSRKINEVAEVIAKKEGYTLVISKGIVIYNGAKNDITDKVIDELNKRERGK